MPRKKWTLQTDVTPELLRFREKKKWQIALRRYILERNKSVQYAGYFGLDIESLRKWIEMQFGPGINWEDFGKTWQFEHIIPVASFDTSLEEELKMCWNFLNIRVELLQQHKEVGNRLDLLAAKGYYREIYEKTSYRPCLKFLEKIARIEQTALLQSDPQQAFIQQHRTYLDMIENYSSFEFELLNNGRSVDEVIKEVDFLKKF
ncbi:MAG: hypothetical protein ABIQ88_08840 [Chitinophagaceae bacterium]